MRREEACDLYEGGKRWRWENSEKTKGSPWIRGKGGGRSILVQRKMNLGKSAGKKELLKWGEKEGGKKCHQGLKKKGGGGKEPSCSSWKEGGGGEKAGSMEKMGVKKGRNVRPEGRGVQIKKKEAKLGGGERRFFMEKTL